MNNFEDSGLETTNLDVFISFFSAEGTTVPEQVDEADGDTTIDVEDELDKGQLTFIFMNLKTPTVSFLAVVTC